MLPAKRQISTTKRIMEQHTSSPDNGFGNCDEASGGGDIVGATGGCDGDERNVEDESFKADIELAMAISLSEIQNAPKDTPPENLPCFSSSSSVPQSKAGDAVDDADVIVVDRNELKRITNN